MFNSVNVWLDFKVGQTAQMTIGSCLPSIRFWIGNLFMWCWSVIWYIAWYRIRTESMLFHLHVIPSCNSAYSSVLNSDRQHVLHIIWYRVVVQYIVQYWIRAESVLLHLHVILSCNSVYSLVLNSDREHVLHFHMISSYSLVYSSILNLDREYVVALSCDTKQ